MPSVFPRRSRRQRRPRLVFGGGIRGRGPRSHHRRALPVAGHVAGRQIGRRSIGGSGIGWQVGRSPITGAVDHRSIGAIHIICVVRGRRIAAVSCRGIRHRAAIRPCGLNSHHQDRDVVRCFSPARFGTWDFPMVDGPGGRALRRQLRRAQLPRRAPGDGRASPFYVAEELLLRTQTTALQGRVMPSLAPPFRIFTLGRCFQAEAVDATHSHTFHQVDAFLVDRAGSAWPI